MGFESQFSMTFHKDGMTADVAVTASYRDIGRDIARDKLPRLVPASAEALVTSKAVFYRGEDTAPSRAVADGLPEARFATPDQPDKGPVIGYAVVELWVEPRIEVVASNLAEAVDAFGRSLAERLVADLGPRFPCDCGKGSYCPQFGDDFTR